MSHRSPIEQSERPFDPSGQTGVIAHIAAYIEDGIRRPVPDPAREAALRCILDLVGAAGAGVRNSGVTALRKTVLALARDGDIPIWFSGLSSSVVGAAWANSAAAAALDLDDGHRLARGHPGAAVIPTAVAVAQDVQAPLEDLIRAIVIGYEVGVAIASARKAYGNTGTWASYAVVATAAALRRTPRNITEQALAIAGESAPNQLFYSAPAQVPPPEGSDVKEGIPWSVVTGLAALGLAEAGHTGPRNVLDSTLQYSFPKSLALGSEPQICRTYFKLYACCRHVHAPIDATLRLLDFYNIDPRSIEAIEVETYSGALRIANSPQPINLVDVQYSIPYCLALVAMAGPQMLLPLTEEALGDNAVAALAGRVTLSLDPALDARFPQKTLARVSISFGDRRVVSEVTAPRGEADSPLSWAELQEKFRLATRLELNKPLQDEFLSAINDARNGSLSSLVACLSRTP